MKRYEPQSNQRGIETSSGLRWLTICPTPCLNRTSVGLKRGFPGDGKPLLKSLNRTSVGLKPDVENLLDHPDCLASIEPAWD